MDKKEKAHWPTHGQSYKKFLIVDDEPDVSGMLALYFNRKKIEGFTAENGQQALQYYEADTSDIGVVVLDTDIGRERGWDVHDRLRTAGYQGIIIAMSGRDCPKEWKDRNVPFLAKPILGRVIEDMVTSILSGEKTDYSGR